jgi:hypothetical protein
VAALDSVLERFNRKERNLLVRAVLGHRKDQSLLLADSFRTEVASKLRIDAIPKNAWWATDYHIDWLAGALAIDAQGESGLCRPDLNARGGKNCSLVEGQQEDFDLVIATGRHLILIEAKAHGTWNDEQLERKRARKKLLEEYRDKLKSDVQIYFLLASPVDPGKDIPWVSFPFEQEGILKVARCDQDGEIKADGDCWTVIPHTPRH